MSFKDWGPILGVLVNFVTVIIIFATNDIFSREFHEKLIKFVHRIMVVRSATSAETYELYLSQSEITRFVCIGAFSPAFVFLAKSFKLAAFLTLIVGVTGFVMQVFGKTTAMSDAAKEMFLEISDIVLSIGMFAVLALLILYLILWVSRKRLYSNV